jgi:uncharacterized protein (DUF305 family)
VVIFYFIRTQAFVDDYQYLSGMIPHHSMAITMSRQILKKTNNPQIIDLANRIIKSQTEEIESMNRTLRSDYIV